MSAPAPVGIPAPVAQAPVNVAPMSAMAPVAVAPVPAMAPPMTAAPMAAAPMAAAPMAAAPMAAAPMAAAPMAGPPPTHAPQAAPAPVMQQQQMVPQFNQNQNGGQMPQQQYRQYQAPGRNAPHLEPGFVPFNQSEAKLFVGNLPHFTTQELLRQKFEPFGTVTQVHVNQRGMNGSCSGFGFVVYTERSAAEAAINGLNGTPESAFDGMAMTMQVSHAQSRSCSLRMTGIPISVTQEEITKVVSSYGIVESVEMQPPMNGEATSAATIAMADRHHCKAVARNLNSTRAFQSQAEGTFVNVEILNPPRFQQQPGFNNNGPMRGGGPTRFGGGGFNGPREEPDPSCNLYVAQLPHDITEERLHALFSPYGQVQRATVIYDRERRPRGFAFVHMGTPDEAQRAIQGVNGSDCDGKNLEVRLRDQRRKQQNQMGMMGGMQGGMGGMGFRGGMGGGMMGGMGGMGGMMGGYQNGAQGGIGYQHTGQQQNPMMQQQNPMMQQQLQQQQLQQMMMMNQMGGQPMMNQGQQMAGMYGQQPAAQQQQQQQQQQPTVAAGGMAGYAGAMGQQQPAMAAMGMQQPAAPQAQMPAAATGAQQQQAVTPEMMAYMQQVMAMNMMQK